MTDEPRAAAAGAVVIAVADADGRHTEPWQHPAQAATHSLQVSRCFRATLDGKRLVQTISMEPGDETVAVLIAPETVVLTQGAGTVGILRQPRPEYPLARIEPSHHDLFASQDISRHRTNLAGAGNDRNLLQFEWTRTEAVVKRELIVDVETKIRRHRCLTGQRR